MLEIEKSSIGEDTPKTDNVNLCCVFKLIDSYSTDGEDADIRNGNIVWNSARTIKFKAKEFNVNNQVRLHAADYTSEADESTAHIESQYSTTDVGDLAYKKPFLKLKAIS